MLALAGVLLLGYLAQNSLLNVYVVYVEYRYGWSVHQIGNSLAVMGAFTILYGIFLVRRASKWFGDRRATLYGLAGCSVGYVIFAAARTGLQFVAGLPVLNLASIAWPATQSMMSRATGPSEQGQLQGAINSLRGIAGVVGPGLFTWIFARAISNRTGPHLPGLPYYAAAVLMACSALLAAVTGREQQPEHRKL